MEVTFGHFFASSRADAVVTRRQLFPPNPSVKPSLIFFGPHHEGTADDFADDAVAKTMAEPQMSASARSPTPLLLVIVRVPSFLVVSWPRPGDPPVRSV